ncbi:MAG: FAD-binding oxidoreductase [Proteobacteria bacterium]|nr:FAD-binding oxidoreductase [Pseudomonadota bacterium]
MSLRAELTALVGANHMLTGEQPAYTEDWRGRYHGRALAVVRPGSTAEVAAVVRACAAHGAAIVPQGGNTGLVGGGVPDASGSQVLLSLTRLTAVRAIDAANLTVTVEAGCTLAALHDAVAAQGLLYPLRLASEGSCTIGGNLATNAGGTQVLRWGNARELCLGLEAVTAQGEIWDGLSGLRKDNSGYALRDLLIGSEGTLAILTAATLKLFPMPTARATVLAACASLADAVALLQTARAGLDAALTGFELMSGHALALVARHQPDLRQPLRAPWLALLQADGPAEAPLLDALAGVLADRDAVVAANLQQAQQLWALREAIPLAQSREGLNIKHDIALPISAIPAFVAEADAAVLQAAPGARLVTFGHLGDGNLHYNVQAPEGIDAAAFLAAHEAPINQLVYDTVQRHGGSFSAEHGIGALKVAELAARKPPAALAMMRAIKTALDPHGTLNPGRLLS